MPTKIEWVDETINPVVGCDNSLPCAERCYAKRMAHRLGGNPKTPQYHGLTECKREIGAPLTRGSSTMRRDKGAIQWTGEVHFVESEIEKPLRWRKPRTVFISSMGDAFHDNTQAKWMDRIMAVAYRCPQHQFVVLTKREGNMRDYMVDRQAGYRVQQCIDSLDVDSRASLQKEEWIPLLDSDLSGNDQEPNWRYEVSSFGRIRSHVGRNPKILRPRNVKGYNSVSLRVQGKTFQHRIANLVLCAFVSVPLEGEEARHVNGNKDDDRLANLVWGTRKENMADAARHGSAGAAMKRDAIFTDMEVVRIRELRCKGATLDELVAIFGTTRQRMSKICRGEAYKDAELEWPPPNLALGVSCSTQEELDRRVPVLYDTPAVCRFVSLEPLLEKVTLRIWTEHEFPPLDGIILGGETGPGARPMHPDWVRGARDQCEAAGVPFFLKGHGEWVHESAWNCQGRPPAHKWEDESWSYRVGKKAAGRTLNNRTFDDLPWGSRQ